MLVSNAFRYDRTRIEPSMATASFSHSYTTRKRRKKKKKRWQLSGDDGKWRKERGEVEQKARVWRANRGHMDHLDFPLSNRVI
jgi:hypothetical protein